MSDAREDKKFRIKNLSFEHEGAHVALVHKNQGGPANRRQTLIFKSQSTADISEEEVKRLLEKASSESGQPGETEVEKAKWNSEVRDALSEAVRKKFVAGDDWVYLEDFNATTLVVCQEGRLFTVSYSLSDSGEYLIADDKQEVEVKRIFVEKGVASIPPEMEEALGEGVYSLLSKALDNPETNERVVKHVSETLEKAKIKMQEEIQKAVDAAVLQKQAEIDVMKEELTKAQEIIAKVEAEKKEAVLKARIEAVAQFDKDGAEALVKATADLADEAFETIVKSLKVKQDALEQSDLFKQASQQGSEAPEAESTTVTLLKQGA